MASQITLDRSMELFVLFCVFNYLLIAMGMMSNCVPFA
jgi:hypothetical protein